MRNILVLATLVATSSAAFDTAGASQVSAPVQAAAPLAIPKELARPTKPPADELRWLSELWVSVPIIGMQIAKPQTVSHPR